MICMAYSWNCLKLKLLDNMHGLLLKWLKKIAWMVRSVWNSFDVLFVKLLSIVKLLVGFRCDFAEWISKKVALWLRCEIIRGLFVKLLWWSVVKLFYGLLSWNCSKGQKLFVGSSEVSWSFIQAITWCWVSFQFAWWGNGKITCFKCNKCNCSLYGIIFKTYFFKFSRGNRHIAWGCTNDIPGSIVQQLWRSHGHACGCGVSLAGSGEITFRCIFHRGRRSVPIARVSWWRQCDDSCRGSGDIGWLLNCNQGIYGVPW